VNAFLGKWLGREAVVAFGVGSVALAFMVALGAVYDVMSMGQMMHGVETHLFPWLAWGDGASRVTVAEVGMLLDPLSAIMILVVTGIGALIHLYSAGYMARDDGFARYFAYLNLFTFAMLVLVLANNLVLLFVGWELVGFCSWGLIGFWFERASAGDAGRKAFITNRVGDFGVLIALFLVWANWGTFSFHATPASMTPGVLDDPAKVLATPLIAVALPLLLLVGVTGKSAQVPLFVWLPDAMEGPTPVSALIHAATMVTAGVYLVARVHPIFDQATEALVALAVVGALTAFIAATIATVQNDIKKVLAYSTVSQLGFMVLGLGAGAYGAAIFHVMTHAFFKALLFLGAGAVMHGLANQQDLRRMGGLLKFMPVTGWTFIVGWLTIIGVPGFSGFFSKDLILARTFGRGLVDPSYFVLYGVALITVGLTAFYMSRLVFLCFLGEYRGADGGGRARPHEAPVSMLVPLAVLAVGSIVAGWVGVPAFLLGGGEGTAIERFLAPATMATGVREGTLGSSTELLLTGLSVAVTLVGVGLAGIVFLGDGVLPIVREFVAPFRHLFANRWFLDEWYGVSIVRPVSRISTFLAAFDIGVVEGTSSMVSSSVTGLGGMVARLQSGYVRGYAVTMLVGAVGVVAVARALR
jgi:NADH-quinone oxidoreductase subunit L